MPPAILYFSWIPDYGMNWRAAGWWTAIAILLFAFVLIHELGHALMARNRGVQAEKIVLFPLGGGAYLPDQPERVRDEVLVYAAGPLANIALALIALPLILSRPDGELLLRYYFQLTGNIVVLPGWLDQLLGLTISVNLLLAFGNLLPAYPLDGGRILRALLRRPMGMRPATIVVTILGVIIGLALIYLGWRIGDPLLMLGAGFIILLSIAEYRNGWQRRRLAKYALSSVLRPATESFRVFPQLNYQQACALFTRAEWPVLPVFDEWNQLRGFLESTVLLEEAPKEATSIRPYCEYEFVTATPSDNLLTVTEKIVSANVYGAAIYGQRGKLEGYVFTEDVMKLLDTPWKRFLKRWRE